MIDHPTLVIVTTDPTPPYEQLRRQLVELIRCNVMAPGDRLPPVRQLASDLGLATGTVARTYRDLESIGLIRSSRGGGTRVAESVEHISAQERHRLIHGQAADYLRRALMMGFDTEAAIDAVQEAARARSETNR